MKTMKYYFINNKGEKQLARSSKTMDYKYALVYEDERIMACSLKKETLETKMRYYTKGSGLKFGSKEARGLWSDQFYNKEEMRIVELIKEGGEK